MAVVWRIMHADVMQFLNNVQVDEAGIREWANRVVADLGYADEVAVSSFKDPALRDGVFLLRCLEAVAPECVDTAIVLPGESAEEREENAKYAISCAHKAGCNTFLGWRDIVELQPKMILCLLAAIMSLDLQREQMAASS
tara:strand:+ start:1016 stop:1435 length:420 start_codon:yes stop_codon:yes gene_type:complete